MAPKLQQIVEELPRHERMELLRLLCETIDRPVFIETLHELMADDGITRSIVFDRLSRRADVHPSPSVALQKVHNIIAQLTAAECVALVKLLYEAIADKSLVQVLHGVLAADTGTRTALLERMS